MLTIWGRLNSHNVKKVVWAAVEAELEWQRHDIGGAFGYDPLLFIPSLGRSVAELTVAEKNQLSHRALAAAELARQMREVWRLG